jgi:hypothetical protein
MRDFFDRLSIAAENGTWLTSRRINAYGAILLAFELLAFLFLVAGTHGWIVPLNKPTTTDFASFYAAGQLADAGMAASTYNQALHFLAEQHATAPGISYVFFFYPPVFILLCALFGRLPYLVAFTLFEVLTLIPCLIVARRILRLTSWRSWVPLLAFPAIFINIGVGQNAFLTASLIGGALLLIDRRPVLAGVLIGALCYKPHYGLLIPIALLAAQRWQTIAAAAISALTLVALSGVTLGWDSWQGFIIAMSGSHSTYESGAVDFAAFTSPFGAVRLLGGSPAAAYAIQAIVSAGAAALTWLAWRRTLSLPIRAATLIAATTIAVPLSLFYDMILSGMAIAWLVRAGREQGFVPWEKTILCFVFLAPALVRGFGTAWHMPVALVASSLLIGACVARIRRESAETARTPLLPALLSRSAAYGT